MSVRVVSATFRVVTPLFLGGAEPAKDCELRPASIKGAMVFWWRALRPDLPLAKLRSEEEALFGSSEGGQSRWLLDACSDALVHGLRLELDEGRGYLAGQGLSRLRKDPQQQPAPQRRFAGANTTPPKPFESSRPYLRPGGRILLRAVRRERSPRGAAEAEGIRDALLALGTFGGLGSRSRRGFGSLHLEEVTLNGVEGRGRDAVVAPTDLKGWQTRISSLPAQLSHSGLPKYSAFSAGTRVLVLDAPGVSAEDLHEALGRSFRSFRSHERSGVGQADHDEMASWLRTGKLEAPPRRAVFGLPHNYYFSSTETKVGVDPTGKSNRRASPLFIHLDEMGDGTDPHAVAVLTFLPAVFLPPGEKMVVKCGGRSIPLRTRDAPTLWQPIHDWLDDLEDSPPLSATFWERGKP